MNRRVLPLFLLLLLACPGGTGPETEVSIPAGSATTAIADTLHAHGIIDNPLKFRVLARLLGYDRRLRHGRYVLRQNTDELAVLRVLTEPGRTSVRVTFPEGFRLTEIAAELERGSVCSDPDFIAACKDQVLLAELSITGKSAEGYLFPDTYEFKHATPAPAVVRRMVRRFRQVYEELCKQHPDPPLPDRQTLILASIIEKEAVLALEAPVISGVFLNRMQRHMPLQSCATVQYVLPVHKECLTYRDTKIKSPYNTYIHEGLPPGPISNPGRRALHAAVNPADTDYLFFVAKGDGGHVFSRTWREHQRAKRRVNRNR